MAIWTPGQKKEPIWKPSNTKNKSSEALYKAVQSGKVKLTDLNENGKQSLKQYMIDTGRMSTKNSDVKGFAKLAKSNAPTSPSTGKGFSIYSSSPLPQQREEQIPLPPVTTAPIQKQSSSLLDIYNQFSNAANKARTFGLSGVLEKGLDTLYEKVTGKPSPAPQLKAPTTTAEKVAAGIGEVFGSAIPIGGLYNVARQGVAKAIPTAVSLPAKIAKLSAPGAASVGAYEGITAATEGKSLKDIGKETAIGAAFGAGGELAGRAIGKGFGVLVNKIKEQPKPTERLNALAEKIKGKPIAQLNTTVIPKKAGFYDPGTLGAAKLTIPERGSTIAGTGEKVRGFQVSAIKAPMTKEETKAGLLADIYEGGPGAYTPVKLREIDTQAKSMVDKNIDDAVRFVTDTDAPSALHTGVGIRTIEKLQNKGDFDRAIDIAEVLADKLTKQGQAISAARIMGSLRPDGILMFAQKQINKVMEQLPHVRKQKFTSSTEGLVNQLGATNKEVLEEVLKRVNLKPTGKTIKAGVRAKTARKSDPSVLLAQSIKSHLKKPKTGKDPVRNMVNILYKVAKETLPAKGKKPPVNQIELIEKALLNKKEYQEVWDKAQEIVRKRLGKKQNIIKYLADRMNVPYSEKQIAAALKQGIKGEGIDLSSIVRQHYTVADKAGKSLIDKLVDMGKLPRQEAKNLAYDIGSKFDELTAQKKQQILNSIFKQKTKGKPKEIDERIIELSNLGALDTDAYRRLTAEKLGLPVLTENTAKELKKLAEVVQSATDDNIRIEAAQELQAAINALRRAGTLQKVETVQTISMLLNPKTQVRNALGNELFYRLERLNKYVSTPIDWARVKLSGGERVVTFATADQGGYWEGFMKGLKAGWKGVNVRGLDTQYSLGKAPSFNPEGGRSERVLSFLERALGASLRAFDTAAYERAYRQTLGELATLRAMNMGVRDKETINRIMKEMDIRLMDIADQYGKYATFQDKNVISSALEGVKRMLNFKQDFGLGSLVIKFPRTPGALLARALEYSPAGFIRSAYQIARPILTNRERDTREVMLSLSRAITGSLGLTGIGYFLADAGIISGKVTSDPDVRELEQQTGQGAYRVNIDALVRWVTSGFDRTAAEVKPDDTFITYDWAQPVATALAIGANMNQSIKGAKEPLENLGTTLYEGMESGTETIAEQPLFQGIKRLTSSYPGEEAGVMRKVTETLAEAPATFIPTLANQIRQLVDNQGRLTYSPSLLQQSLKKAAYKIPGIASKLPPSYTTLGEPKEVYQDESNTLFNVFLNPSFVSRYKVSPEAQTVIDVFKETGNSTVVPRKVKNSITIQGKKIQLTPDEYSEFQRVVGLETAKGLKRISSIANDEAKVKGIVNVLDRAAIDGKVYVLKQRGEKVAVKGKTIRIGTK